MCTRPSVLLSAVRPCLPQLLCAHAGVLDKPPSSLRQRNLGRRRAGSLRRASDQSCHVAGLWLTGYSHIGFGKEEIMGLWPCWVERKKIRGGLSLYWAESVHDIRIPVSFRFLYMYVYYTLYIHSIWTKIVGIQVNTLELKWARP